MHIVKHFAATTYVFDQSMQRSAFVWHRKLQSWLPPGGHIEENESHEAAALREIREELGIATGKFIVKGSFPEIMDKRARIMLTPHFIIEEKIEENYFHLDMIFYAITDDLHSSSPEGLEIRWFSLDEIKKEKQMLGNVKYLAEYGFQLKPNQTLDFSFIERSLNI